MTPEQTLEWLAKEHFDQCREERPIQDWIRKMKAQLPEQPKQNTVEAVKAVLKGIDKTEIESPDGWWETSDGAEFGAKKLKYVIGLLAQPEQEHEFENWLKNQFEWKNFYYKGTGPSEMAVNFAKKAFNAGQSMVNPYVPTERQRAWVGLTDEDKKEYVAQDFGGNRLDAMDWAEKRLKDKNT